MLTMARSGRRRYTPASSEVSVPTSMSALSNLGKPCKTCTRSAGPSLAAQPAALTVCVRRTALFFPSFIEFDFNSIVFLFQSLWLIPRLLRKDYFQISESLSFPHALSWNPGESETGPD